MTRSSSLGGFSIKNPDGTAASASATAKKSKEESAKEGTRLLETYLSDTSKSPDESIRALSGVLDMAGEGAHIDFDGSSLRKESDGTWELWDPYNGYLHISSEDAADMIYSCVKDFNYNNPVFTDFGKKEDATAAPTSPTASSPTHSSPKEIPATAKPMLSKYSSYASDRNAKAFKTMGISQETQDKATATLSKMFDQFEFSTRTNPKFLEDIVFEHYKTQFETGSSDGAYDPLYRSGVGSRLFGYDGKTLGKTEHEKYGYLSDTVEEECRSGGGSGYGSLRITWKKDALDGRVTYTLGDSFGTYSHTAAGSVNVNGSTTLGGISSYAKNTVDKLAK